MTYFVLCAPVAHFDSLFFSILSLVRACVCELLKAGQISLRPYPWFVGVLSLTSDAIDRGDVRFICFL